jgi:hypothetical protein
VSGTIHLGYTVADAKGYPGGEAVEIPLRHTAVTGQTQESGKTTTLEGLISRSGLQAVAYVTKRGESSFHVMHPIAPYFQERADWEFVQSLLEAATNTKQDFKQSWIMRASEGAKTLGDVRGNIRRFLEGVRDTTPVKLKKGAEPKERWKQKPARGLNADVYYVLDKYLDGIMPQLEEMPYTTALALAPGLNVMDLRDYEFPLQALVIRSVTDFIRERLEETINIIPEAWKFAPKQRGSPVRLAAEEYVREAAAMKNFLWIDSQDLAGVADVLMRQVGVWLFGVQRAKHEIERALDHMPEGLPARRPRPADIATLSKGQFYVCFGREMHKVYVQPAWMTAAHAEAIARGEEEVNSAHEILKEYAHGHSQDRVPAASSRNARKKAAPEVRESEDVQVPALSGRGADSSAGGAASDRGTQHRADSAATEAGQTSSPREMRQEHATQHTGSGNDAAAGTPAAQRGSQRTSTAAGDAAPLAAHPNPEEDAMWKEKYEALNIEFKKLLADFEKLRGVTMNPDLHTGRAPDPKHGHGATLSDFNGVGNLEEIYRFVRGKLAQEIQAGDALLAHVLMDVPELKVTRQRRTLQMSDTETPGRIAVLIAEKFFDSPQNSGTVTKEFKRRGWFSVKTSNAAVLRPLTDIAEMGFLTRDGVAYQAVPGMKVNIIEA